MIQAHLQNKDVLGLVKNFQDFQFFLIYRQSTLFALRNQRFFRNLRYNLACLCLGEKTTRREAHHPEYVLIRLIFVHEC